jgi:hypothetical protein
VTGTALEIVDGAIKVTGAGVGTPTAAFIHQVNAANRVTDKVTRINHPLTNNDPHALLFVSKRYGYSHMTFVRGVWYDAGYWFLGTDGNDLKDGDQFSVLVIKP